MNFWKYYTNSDSDLLLSEDRKIIRKRNKEEKLSAGLVAEASVLSRIDHPNIIKLLRVVKENDGYYIELPFVEQTLHSLISGKREIYDRKSIAYQILLALEYLESIGIAHFDLKPQNIMIEKNLITEEPFVKETVKLIDFDIAEVIVPSVGREKITTKYRPIENLIDTEKSYTFQSDIWSYGMVIYELYTGKYVSDHSGLPFISDLRYKLEHPDLRKKFLEKNIYDRVLVDFLYRIFEFDRDFRPTASELLKHCFFDSVKSKVECDPKIGPKGPDPKIGPKGPEVTDFISSMKSYTENFTEKENEIIVRIFEEYCSKTGLEISHNLQSIYFACTDLGLLLLGYTPTKKYKDLREKIWEELGYTVYFPPRRVI